MTAELYVGIRLEDGREYNLITLAPIWKDIILNINNFDINSFLEENKNYYVKGPTCPNYGFLFIDYQSKKITSKTDSFTPNSFIIGLERFVQFIDNDPSLFIAGKEKEEFEFLKKNINKVSWINYFLGNVSKHELEKFLNSLNDKINGTSNEVYYPNKLQASTKDWHILEFQISSNPFTITKTKNPLHIECENYNWSTKSFIRDEDFNAKCLNVEDEFDQELYSEFTKEFSAESVKNSSSYIQEKLKNYYDTATTKQ